MTALSFDLDPVDAAVVSVLRAPGNLGVHVGSVSDSDGDAKTIGASLPYVLYGSALPFGTSPRIGGNRPGTTEFTVTYVNATSDGCKAVAAAVRHLLDGREVAGGGRVRRRQLGESITVARDETWTRPGGLPLFHAVDRYFVA